MAHRDGLSRKVLLVGWDAADWGHINPLLEEGLMPTLDAFINREFDLVGFKFNNGGGDQYGWVRVKMLGVPKNMAEVVDYAYGDPGDTVFAGQKSDESAFTLESLGGLALGAAGLLTWRQRTPALVH